MHLKIVWSSSTADRVQYKTTEPKTFLISLALHAFAFCILPYLFIFFLFLLLIFYKSVCVHVSNKQTGGKHIFMQWKNNFHPTEYLCCF